MRVLALAVGGAALSACGAGLGAFGQSGPLASAVETAACPELSGGAMSASFDANARANATIRAFVQAAGDLSRVAAAAEAEVRSACERMGADLGLSADQMVARGGEGRTDVACSAVAARIDAILAEGARGSIKIDVTPPRCSVNADLEAACKGQCSAQIDPGYVRANCEPGELYGRCEGTCRGACSGTCSGTCQGDCEGSTGADGACNGHCTGTCSGSCQGDCKGSCSVELIEPKCAVAMRPPAADGRCESACRADANLQGRCTPAVVRVASSTTAGDIPRLVATLQANLPALIKAQVQYGARLADDIQVLVRTGAELPSAFGHLSAHAASCIAAAASATVRAQASIRVSVQASASISASAGAGARR